MHAVNQHVDAHTAVVLHHTIWLFTYVLDADMAVVQGRPKELKIDDDAREAALQWASEAAFGNTEVAAPKILGDIIESLVGAVYLDTKHHFDKTWEVCFCSLPVVFLML